MSKSTSVFDQADLSWIADISTDLRLILGQILRYSEMAARHKGEPKYLDLSRERAKLGAKTVQALYDRVTATIRKEEIAPNGQQNTSPSRTVTARRRVKPTSPATVQNDRLTNRAKVTDTKIPPDIAVKNRTGQRELILLIEDETEVAELAAEMLAFEGYRVVVAPNGVEALKIYERIGKQIALVILDFFMPIMDGDAVFEELRLLNPKIDVVLSSGFAEQNKISSMLADGLRGFIPKPYTGERLLAQVRSTLDAAEQAIA